MVGVSALYRPDVQEANMTQGCVIRIATRGTMEWGLFAGTAVLLAKNRVGLAAPTAMLSVLR